jgi:antitoxin HigA-1
MTNALLSIGVVPSHPGAIVREEILAPLGLNVTKVAKALDVRRATLSDLLNEKAALFP